MKKLAWLLAPIILAGCQTGPLEDPNDAKTAGILAPDVIRRQLKGTSEMLMNRVSRGELSDAEFKDLIAKRANELLKDVPMEKISPEKAWEYGEIFRTAKRYQQAKQALTIAVDYAIRTKNEDRRINDLIRLAHVEAMLGDANSAVNTAKRTLDAKPEASAPILPGVLLEIVPAAKGKGKDFELGQLLEQAIDKHVATVVDPDSEAGQMFLLAKPHHVRNAWTVVFNLYLTSGHEAEARKALAEGEEMMGSMRRV